MKDTSGIISFTSDFGMRDGYVGIVKGIISRFNPNAHVIDLSHEIEPFDVVSAAWIIYNSYRFFPEDAVHLVVVDPQVGTEQRRLLLTDGSRSFVGPDSGVFGWLLTDPVSYPITEPKQECYVRADFKDQKWTAYELTNKEAWLSEVSHSFHARDLFAPVCAALSKGTPPSVLGTEVPLDELKLLEFEPPFIDKSGVSGCVIHIDHYGNLISNIPSAEVHPESKCSINEVEIGGLTSTYGSAPKGSLLAFRGSHGFIEIAVNQGRADEKLKATVGCPVLLA